MVLRTPGKRLSEDTERHGPLRLPKRPHTIVFWWDGMQRSKSPGAENESEAAQIKLDVEEQITLTCPLDQLSSNAYPNSTFHPSTSHQIKMRCMHNNQAKQAAF